jgi:hypothetical protein
MKKASLPRIPAKRVIFVVQYMDKMTWRDCNKEFHSVELDAYNQQRTIREQHPDVRYRVLKFEAKE